MLNGVGMGDSEMKKINLIKRLTNQGFNMQSMAVNALFEYLKSEREREDRERAEYERQQKEKDRILRRIMDQNLRFAGMAFRQAYQHMQDEAEKERQLMFKQRGIMRRMIDSNTRLMSAGYNKLIEEYKARKGMLKNQLRFIIKALTDKDANFIKMAYGGLKERKMMLDGVGMGDAQMKKVSLMKRLLNQGFNQQSMAMNSFKAFLVWDREREERERLEF